MSSKNDNPKSEYRKNKKINKSNIRSGRFKKQDFIINEDSILNSLPSGAFDKNNIELNHEKNQKLVEKMTENKDIEKKNEVENIDEEEYEEYQDDN